ncbi:MAG: hypothetical protein Q8K26_04830 [Candidatus Gracilibacteria bacterium]|nr:hypothetical protein [Candidatus Gracilibacteria bacterium]
MSKDIHGLSSFACDTKAMGEFAQRLGLEIKEAPSFIDQPSRPSTVQSTTEKTQGFIARLVRKFN